MVQSRQCELEGTVLVLGGTGKVGSRVVSRLKSANIPSLVASRSSCAPEGQQGVKFDWLDRETWKGALSAASSVRAVFIVVQGFVDPSAMVNEFIDLAREHGVKRFVLLSQSPVDENGPAFGLIHRYLLELGNKHNIGWAVLRPTWFQQNFSELGYHVESITKENAIYSATGQGVIPWVSCDDIAAVGFYCLISPESPNTDFLVLGPQLLTYDNVAQIFTEVLGRKIVHHSLTQEEGERRYQSIGIPVEFAKFLVMLETGIKNGDENRVNNVVQTVTSQEARKFKDFVEANKARWYSSEDE